MEFTLRKIVLLIGSLLIALGPWVLSLEAWCNAVTPQSVAVLFGIVGGVLVAWVGESPLRPRK